MFDSNIKAAIFDLDGVVFDSMGIWQDLGVRYLDSLGIKAELGLSQILFAMSMEQGAGYIVNNYPVGKNQQQVVNDLQNIIRDFYFYQVKAKEGAPALLESLTSKGILVAAATSSPREHVTKALTRLGLIKYFKGIFTTSEVGKSKHEPLVYNLTSQFLGAKPIQTLVFEDSLYALETAAKAGYRTVGVFDAAGETDQEGLKRESEVYVKSLSDFKF